MPILLVLALTAACLPVKWPAPLLGGGNEAALAFAITAVGLSLLAAISLRTWVIRTLRQDPFRKPEVASVYMRLRHLLFFANVGMTALCIGLFGWGWLVQETLEVNRDGKPVLAPFAELAVPLPYFVVLFGAWTIYYDAERMLHRTSVLGPIDRPFWSRAGYFFNHLRQFVLLVMLPVGLFVTQQTILRVTPETAQSDWYRIASVLAIPLLVLLMPLLIKPMLGLKSMPAGPIRDRLEALSKRLHFRCTDFLLWPTHGAVVNAMIVGLLPRVRYVIFTDRILEELPPVELDAVFGHEVGHAKHGHIWFYALFLALSMTVLVALMILIYHRLEMEEIKVPLWAEEWPAYALMVGYLFLVFGYLSRRCERQADVFGCRAVSCANPNCMGHDAATIYPERGLALCRTGIRTFVHALERVGHVNGYEAPEDDRTSPTLGSLLKGFFGWLRAWLHSTIPLRVTFLLKLIGHPERERRFQWSVTFLQWGLMLGLGAALYAIGSAIGWDELLRELRK